MKIIKIKYKIIFHFYSMTQNNSKSEIGLNLHLSSFKIPSNIIGNNDNVRISITTLPDNSKQNFTIKGKKMDSVDHIFSFNITKETEKIVFVFRKKKMFSGNPMVASSTIKIRDFINSTEDGNSEIKMVNLYYPLQMQMQEEMKKNGCKKQFKRKIIGKMQIQLSFTSPFEMLGDEIKIKKVKKEKKHNFSHSKYDYSRESSENSCNTN